MTFVLAAVTALSLAAPRAPAATLAWKPLAPGVEYAAVALAPKPAIGDGLLHVVRIDPARASVRALSAAERGGKLRTAAGWSKDHHLVVVINAGMYESDGTHTGYLRAEGKVLAPRWAKDYRSILLVDPGAGAGPAVAGRPAAEVADADETASPPAYAGWGTVIQNLRLIRRPGASVWKENGRRWSEAALAADGEGRLLFLFCRSPFSMHELNARLLSLPLGIVAAMHLEGGPEASLSVHGGGVDLDLAGSYETGFHERDDNAAQWELPNVLGVEAR